MFSKLIKILSTRILEMICAGSNEGNALLQKLAQSLAVTPILFGGGWDKVYLGKNVHVVNALFNLVSGRVVVGDNSFFGHNVCLLTGTHDISGTGLARHTHPLEGGDINIGQGVWISSNVTILGPCVIEDDVVVAAGAVVVKGLLERGGIYAGIPARRIN